MPDDRGPFYETFGDPNPASENGLRFTNEVRSETWEILHRRVGSGWFRDRFLYLFGPGLERLLPCLDAWSFLVPPNRDRMIVGRNAHGALLVVHDANSSDPAMYVLDPFRIAYWTTDDFAFRNLTGYWLPQNAIPHFLDDKVYKRWRKAQHGADLPEDSMLAPKLPVGLGGKFELANFQEEEILTFYQTSAPIYQKAFESGGKQTG